MNQNNVSFQETEGFQLHKEFFELVEGIYINFLHKYSLLDQFTFPELKAIVSKPTANTSKDGKAFARAIKILKEYQEKPSLLDKHIEQMVRTPVAILELYISYWTQRASGLLRAAEAENKGTVELRIDPESETDAARIFSILAEISKVRGIKKISIFFSSKVETLEPVFEYAVYQSKSTKTSDTQYILLNWLSLLANIPLQLNHIDSGISYFEKYQFHLNDLFVDSWNHISAPDLTREWVLLGLDRCLYTIGTESRAASVMLAQLVKRKDVSEKYLVSLISYFKDLFLAYLSQTSLVQQKIQSYHVNNALYGLCCLVSVTSLAVHSMDVSLLSAETLELWAVIKNLMSFNKTGKRQPISNKLLSKATQRLAIMSLQNELGIDYVCIEEMLSTLIEMMVSKETVVRWSAVKGISKICLQINDDDFVEQIIQTIFDTLLESTYRKTNTSSLEDNWWSLIDISMAHDSTWHGCCLCISEFLRLRLIKDPKLVSKILPYLFIALKFEVLKGSYLVGDNVRDAACYMAWCLARSTVNVDSIAPLIHNLGKTLVSVMLFDREVHVRRAASAAFQEFLGRSNECATFIKGLDILQLADYYSVGNLTYVPHIAGKISSFEEYRVSLVNHISLFSLVQPDVKLQITSTESLQQIIRTNCQNNDFLIYVYKKILPHFLALTNSPESSIRYGSILGLKALFSVSEVFTSIQTAVEADAAISTNVKSVLNLPEITHQSFLKGNVGSINVLGALSELAESLSKNENLSFENYHPKWELVFEIAISKDDHDLQIKATEKWSVIFRNQKNIAGSNELVKKLVERAKSSGNVVLKRGSILALSIGGVFHEPGVVDSILRLLIDLISSRDASSVECVRNAAICIGTLVTNFGDSINDSTLLESLDALLGFGLKNYQSDHRGDVGSWVRLASLNSINMILSMEIKNVKLPFGLYLNLVASALELCLSLQSNIRVKSGDMLNLLLQKHYNFEGSSDLAMIVGPKIYSNYPSLDPKIDYITISPVYELFSNLLKPATGDIIDSSLLRGFIVAAGNLSESIAQAASSELINATLLLDQAEKEHVLLTFVSVFKNANDSRDVRLVMPALRVLEMFISDQVFDPDHANKVLPDLVFQVRRSVYKSWDLNKIMQCIKVYQLLSLFDAKLAGQCLRLLSKYLICPIPKARQFAADQLAEFIELVEDYYPETTISDPGRGESALIQVSNTLTKTDWMDSLDKSSNSSKVVVEHLETIISSLKQS